ncbi:hypothetical protein K439DRAFT_1623638 [Ramaria rubella]|nr:hypothetical protein K439DRAFT_1623638 [Ramaria rubella]
MASTLISLSMLNKNEHLKEVIAAIGSDVHQPPTLTKKLGEVYGHLGYNDLHSCYYAIVVSILEVFSPHFGKKSASVFSYGMPEMMKATPTLKAEKSLWNQVLQVSVGEDFSPFSAYPNWPLKITGSSSRSCLDDLMSSGHIQLQGMEMIQQLHHHTLEMQLDQLAAVFGTTDSTTYSIKREVWPHADILYYQVPNDVVINLDAPGPVKRIQPKSKKSASSPSKKRKREPSPASSNGSEAVAAKKEEKKQPLAHPEYPEGTVGRLADSLGNFAMDKEVSLHTTPFPTDPSIPQRMSPSQSGRSTSPGSPVSETHIEEEGLIHHFDNRSDSETGDIVWKYQQRLHAKQPRSPSQSQSQPQVNRECTLSPVTWPIHGEIDQVLLHQSSKEGPHANNQPALQDEATGGDQLEAHKHVPNIPHQPQSTDLPGTDGHKQAEPQAHLMADEVTHRKDLDQPWNGSSMEPSPAHSDLEDGNDEDNNKVSDTMLEDGNQGENNKETSKDGDEEGTSEDSDEEGTSEDSDDKESSKDSDDKESSKDSDDKESSKDTDEEESSENPTSETDKASKDEGKVEKAGKKGKGKPVDVAALRQSEHNAKREGKNLAGMQDTSKKGKGKGKGAIPKPKPKPNPNPNPTSDSSVSPNESEDETEPRYDEFQDEDVILTAPDLSRMTSIGDVEFCTPLKPRLSLESRQGEEVHLELATVWEDTGDPSQPFVKHSFNLRWPTSSMNSIQDFHDMLEASGHNQEQGPYRSESCISVLDATIASWSDEKLLQMHKQFDIHVICKNRSHDLDNFHTEMRQGSLHQLFNADRLDPGRQDVNFLTIPLPQNATPPDYVRPISLIGCASQHYGATPFPSESLSWGLVATVPAMSPTHRDAGKFAMYIEVISGTKLWSLLDNGPSSSPPPSVLVEINAKKYRWTGLVLRPGHVLIMRPGREHLVYTLEDSILRGGHFYSKVTLRRSLKAGLQEHWWGCSSTNTEHLASESILYQLVQHYSHCLAMKDDDDNVHVDLPEDDELAALLAIVMCPEEFEPEMVEDEQGEVVPWMWLIGLKEDRWRAKGAASSILHRMESLYPLCQDNWNQIIEYAVRNSHSEE